jgi:YbbR domain-containing protein
MSETSTNSKSRDRRLLVRNIFKKVFFEDWVLKLVALVITAGLWLGVTGLSTPATKRLSVQLAPNTANNIEITENPITEVGIVISGDERRLRSITSNGLVAALDLTRIQPGDRVISLTPDNVTVDLPVGIKLDEIQPSRIAMRLEAVLERELPVKPDVEGQPASGFEVYSESISPARVRVRGPASFVETLDHVLTDKISIAGKSQDFTVRQVPLGVSNDKTTVFNTVVDVTFRIGEKRVSQTFVLPPSPQTENRRVSLTLVGTRPMMAQIRQADIKISIVKNENGRDVPTAALPPDVQNTISVKEVKFIQ